MKSGIIGPLLLTVVAGLAAMPCRAQGPTLRPGQWESTVHREGSGVVLPPGLSQLSPEKQARLKAAMARSQAGKHDMTVHSCLTADEIKQMSLGSMGGKNDDECKSSTKQLSSDRWSITTHCAQRDGGVQDMHGTIHVIDSGHLEQDMTMSMSMGGQQTQQQMHVDGKWVGATCSKHE